MLTLQVKGVSDAIARLNAVAKNVAAEKRNILEYAAIPVVNAAQQKAPVGTKMHVRYNTQKVNKSMRAPKGMGVVVATYRPGNLKKSVRILKKLRRSQAVFVGVQLGRKNPDGYYAHFVEYGTLHTQAKPFMRPAAAESQSEVVRRIEYGVKRIIKKHSI